MVKIELLYSTDYEPEVMDDGEEVFEGADLDDHVVSMVSAAVIGQDEEISEVQSCGQSDLQRGRAALLDLGDHAKTGDKQADCTGMRPAEAEDSKSLKSGETACLDCTVSIVPVVERQTGAHLHRGRTWRSYVFTAWVGIRQAGRLFCCCSHRWK